MKRLIFKKGDESIASKIRSAVISLRKTKDEMDSFNEEEVFMARGYTVCINDVINIINKAIYK